MPALGHSTSCTASFHPPTEINGMIRLYRQTPEGIERTTQVDAAEQHLDSVFWIDLLTPEPAEIKFVERLCGLEMPTYDEMREIEATSRLYTEDGARFMTTTVLSRVDTESPPCRKSPSSSWGRKSSPSAIRTPIPSAFFPPAPAPEANQPGPGFHRPAGNHRGPPGGRAGTFRRGTGPPFQKHLPQGRT
ncbi:MAG: hypothetical protein ACLT38_07215 [Akkermansia sp.]